MSYRTIKNCDLCGRDDPDVFAISDWPDPGAVVAHCCLECKETKTIMQVCEAWDRVRA